jgi:hypothetical protein
VVFVTGALRQSGSPSPSRASFRNTGPDEGRDDSRFTRKGKELAADPDWLSLEVAAADYQVETTSVLAEVDPSASSQEPEPISSAAFAARAFGAVAPTNVRPQDTRAA